MAPIGRPHGLLPWLLVSVLTVVTLWPLATYRLDDAFITHRYARNLAAGHGLVYTPGEPALLGTSSPGFAILLAGLSRATGFEPPEVAWALALLATVAAGLLFHRLLRRFLPEAASIAGALFLVTNPVLARSTGLETALYVAVALAVLLALDGGLLWAAGLLTGAALWLRLDAVTLAVPALLAWRRSPRRRPVVAPAEGGAAHAMPAPPLALGGAGGRLGALVPWLGGVMLVFLPWALWAFGRYGTVVPSGWAAKRAGAAIVHGARGYDLFARGLWRLPRELVAESPAYLLWLPLAVLGAVWLARRRPRPAVLLAAWSMVYFAAFELAGLPWRHLWYWAPLQLPLVVAGAAGVEALAAALERRRPALRRWAFGLGVLALLYILLLAQVESSRRSPQLPLRAAAYREIGEVLRCRPGERLAAWEVGILGYYSGCPMLDLAGILSPEVRAIGPEAALERTPLRWAVDVRPPGWVADWSVGIRGGGEVVVYVPPPLVLTD